MKILELRFKNLNSLYGEWHIDFTDPEYDYNGIFALTGPTGAGKSTILDAICLALYGATPRLGRITQSSNDIMSRQTGECYAEVVFESQAGRFRCHWGQHRSRKNRDGDLQIPRHEIAEAIPGGKVMENQLRLVLSAVEEKTGMDFDRFTRSILLAQGGFDTFLKATAEQKSKILEQITGTNIYSEISIGVHNRKREEQRKLDLLQAETSGIIILAPEEEHELHEKLKNIKEQEPRFVKLVSETGHAITWVRTIATLQSEIKSLLVESEKLQHDVETFKPEQSMLDRANKAASLEGTYATLTEIRSQQSNDITSLEAEEAALPDLEEQANNAAEALKLAQECTLEEKKELQSASKVIQQVRLLDQKLDQQKQAVVESKDSCIKDKEAIEKVKKAQADQQEKRSEAGNNLELIETYLAEHGEDAWLVNNLSGVEERLNNLVTKQHEIGKIKTNKKQVDAVLKAAQKALDTATKQYNANKNELDSAKANLKLKEEALQKHLSGRLLREYRTEKEALLREKEFLAKIAALTEHRAKLEDGKPCPLCGATEHPFALGNVPIPDEVEHKINTLETVIAKAEDFGEEIHKLGEIKDVALLQLTNSEAKRASAENVRDNTKKRLDELKVSLQESSDDFTEEKQIVSDKLLPLGITEIPDDDVSALFNSLKDRLKTWQDYSTKKSNNERKIADIDSEIKRLSGIVEIQNSALEEKKERLEVLEKEYKRTSDERIALYGTKNPDAEEERLNQKISAAEEAEKRAGTRNTDVQQKLSNTKTKVESLNKSIKERKPKLNTLEADFNTVLVETGFTEEAAFQEARRTNTQRNELAARAKELEERQTALKATQKDRKGRLAIEEAKEVTEKSLEELQPLFEEYEGSLKQLRDDMVATKLKLDENSNAQERIKEKRKAIEAQEKESLKWGKLHSLIGSADGKKYRNFAQGLTFELMVSHANRQLIKMSDRYLLIRDNLQPLELNVIDNYQAGEIRSTKNLSGGESFIISLALALGLSQMASRKVRVDSLFLDEGFGSLDEETLETALKTLSSLQQDGKLIGVISHVSAMKEMISTQISILSGVGGRSTITGPGCRRVDGSE
ncbi:MAG: AAA family ATPase [Sphaerochaetaceae bacterium]|nr:AAA family ATPase [Sphaerochaetaceae bacterium]